MSTRWGVAVLLLAALVLRLGSNAWLTQPTPGIDGDALWYHSTASSLAAGQGYVHHFTRLPTAAWPPGYAAILAPLYRVFGPDPSVGFFLNALAGTLTCWLAGRLAFAATGSTRALVLATALAAFTPSHVLFASLLLSETVFTTIMMALVLAAVTLVRRSQASAPWAAWFAWGVGVGLASLVRAEAVILLAAPVVALLATRTRIAVAGAVAAVALAGVVAGELPWLVRNAALFGRIVPVSVSFGRTFLIGHNPVADGGMNDWSPDAARDARELMSGPAGELAVDERLRDAGIRFMLENPAREAVLVLRRFHAMFRGDRVWGEWYVPGDPARVTPRHVEWLGKISSLYYWLLVALALPSFVLVVRERSPGRVVLAVTAVAWTAFFVLVLYGTQRFHFPLLPVFCVFAADTLSRGLERVAWRGGVASARPS